MDTIDTQELLLAADLRERAVVLSERAYTEYLREAGMDSHETREEWSLRYPSRMFVTQAFDELVGIARFVRSIADKGR